jgi:hypothetical protein
MKLRFAYLFMGLVLLASGIARADYTGQSINGTLAFGTNGANGGQFWVPSSIVVPNSFFYQDGANIDTAAFSGTQLTITDQVLSNAGGWEMTFAAPGSPFTVLNLVSSSFAPGITFSLSGGVITVDWIGTGNGGQTLTAVFDIVPAASPVPEPSSLALLGTGCLYGLNLIRRKRA